VFYLLPRKLGVSGEVDGTMETTILEFLTHYGLRILAAVAVLLLGRFLAGRLRKLTKEVLDRPDIDKALSESMESILIRLVFYGTLVLAGIVALAILGVPVTAILSVSSALLVVLAVALRESLANFAATIIFMIYQPFRVGEEIESLGRRGIVREIQLFSTVLRQPDRSLAVLPNGDLQKDGLINYTRLGISRVDLAFTLKYEADVEKAWSIIMEIMTDDECVLEEPPPVVVVMNMGENGLEMQARPFVRYIDYDPVQFSFRQWITEALNAACIEPAVSMHDVQVHSLTEME
jgi:small conductance mechanosensitive channel